jgi:hypothetical protein
MVINWFTALMSATQCRITTLRGAHKFLIIGQFLAAFIETGCMKVESMTMGLLQSLRSKTPPKKNYTHAHPHLLTPSIAK